MIKFHFSYIIVAFIMVISGYYLNLVAITSLILFHELGHFLTAKLLGFKVINIIIYPYGGMTKLDDLINKDIFLEFLVAIAGIIFQILFFTIISVIAKSGGIREKTLEVYRLYHYQMLIFNLLPIYPLDGAKILKCLCDKFLWYDLANKILVIVSIVVLIFVLNLNWYNKNYTYFLSLMVLASYIVDYFKKIHYLYNRFLLERYIYKIYYKDVAIINNPRQMFKNKSHIIKDNSNHGKYILEKEYLKRYFQNKGKFIK